MYTFHVTRHTFAFDTYLIEKLSGNARPWRTVADRLGHVFAETTEKYYLKCVEEAEPRLTRDIITYVNHMAGRPPEVSG
jgi:integrase